MRRILVLYIPEELLGGIGGGIGGIGGIGSDDE